MVSDPQLISSLPDASCTFHQVTLLIEKEQVSSHFCGPGHGVKRIMCSASLKINHPELEFYPPLFWRDSSILKAAVWQRPCQQAKDWMSAGQ